MNKTTKTIPTPGAGESEQDYLNRCMSALSIDVADDNQRAAICYDTYRRKKKEQAAQVIMREIDRIAAAFKKIRGKK